MPEIVSTYVRPQTLEEDWDIAGLEKQMEQDFQQKFPIMQWLQEDTGLNDETLTERIVTQLCEAYKTKQQRFLPEAITHVEKMLMLQLLDGAWREHLASMEQLRQGIYLRSYAQKNPTQEFKREAFSLFTRMLTKLKYDLISALAKVHIDNQDENLALAGQQPEDMQLNYQHADQVNLLQAAPASQAQTPVANQPEDEPVQKPYVWERRKIGRNEPCYCGSGKKYKQCCGKVE